MNKIQKPISILTSITTTVWLSGAAMLVPMSAMAAPVDGDLIRNPNAEGAAQFDIYIVKEVDGEKYKRLILSPHVFESYEHFDKNSNGSPWDDVTDVGQSVMDQYETSDLVRVDGGTKVYRLNAADGADTGDKYWLNMTADDFLAVFDADAIYTINSTDSAGYTEGSQITDPSAIFPPEGAGDEGDESDESEGTLTVSLAADTPAAGIVVENAARVPFTKINLTASGGDVIIDQLIVERTGLGQDGAFSSIDVIDGSTNMPINNTSKTFNSVHRATVNDDLTVESGETVAISLAGNFGADLSSYTGETPSLTLAELTLKGDATLNADLPITGNQMSINHTITIGTATVQRGAYGNASSTSIKVGEEQYTFFSFQVQAGSAEKIEFSQVKIYQEGSAAVGVDLTNVKLYKDNAVVAENPTVTTKYATFDFDQITIDKGQIVQFQVKADVADGSARTVDLGIYKETDLLVKGVTYSYNITPTYSGTGSSGNNPVLSDNEFTISDGTLNVTRSNEVTALNIGVSDDEWIGAFEFDCKGEEIDIAALSLTIVSSTGNDVGTSALLNLELVDPDGDVVAGPKDPDSDGQTVAWTDTFTVPVGKTVYKVRGDLQSSANWASNDTVYVQFNPSAMTATGVTTGNSITATPSSNVTANTQTVKAASLTVARNSTPADQTIIVGSKDVVLTSWDFDASASGEDIRITSVGFTAAAAGMAATNTNALTIYVDGVAQSPVNDAIASNAAAAKSSTFALDEALVIEKGASVTVELRGDKTTIASDDTENWGIRGNSIVAYGADTGTSFEESVTADDGPTLTNAAKGILSVDIDTRPTSAIVLTGSTDNTFAGVAFSSLYEDARLDNLTVHIEDGGYEFSSSSNYADVKEVCLYHDGDYLTGDRSGSCGSIPSSGTKAFEFSVGDLDVAAGTNEIITIKADMPVLTTTINQPSYASADIKLGFGGANSIQFTGKSSNSELTGASYESYNDSTSSYMVLYNSKPTVTVASSADSLDAATTLTDGVQPIFAFKVSADASGGDVLLYRATFHLSTSSGSGINIKSCYVKYSGDDYGSKIKAAANPFYYVDDDQMLYTATFDNPNFDITGATTDEAIKIGAGSFETFRLYCTVSGASAAGENVSTFLVGDTASTSANVGYTNCANNTGGTCSGGFHPQQTAVLDAPDLSAASTSNFIWSDNWLGKSISASGQSNATSSAMWYNGYLVPGMEKSVTTTAYVLSY